MRALLDIILLVLQIYIWLLIAAAVLSWLIAFNVVNTRNQVVAMIGEFLYRITEPLLRPIRSMLPDLGGIDVSPVILILIILFLENIIVRYIYPTCSSAADNRVRGVCPLPAPGAGENHCAALSLGSMRRQVDHDRTHHRRQDHRGGLARQGRGCGASPAPRSRHRAGPRRRAGRRQPGERGLCPQQIEGGGGSRHAVLSTTSCRPPPAKPKCSV